MSYAITVGDEQIFLADSVDVTELKSEVVRNVHAGGGWVALPLDEDRSSSESVEIFVSAGQNIRIDEEF